MNLLSQIQEKSIEQYAQHHSLKGVKVLLRVDVNVSVNEHMENDWRIAKALRTISYLMEQGACVVVLSHIGREPSESLKPVFEVLSQKIQIGFLPRYDTELITHTIEHMQFGSAVMLENLRQHEGETENDASFLEPIAALCDLYVNDAFAVSHREHASVAAVTTLLPSYFGLQFVDEVTELSTILDTKGGTLVLGGAKFGTKLELLRNLLPQLSFVLLGGALANVFLKARGFGVGKSLVDDVDISDMLSSDKIILPVDCVDQEGDVVHIDEVGDEDMILDIGPETEVLFQTIIASSPLIVWNGPMGKYESGYRSGSLAMAEGIAHSKGYSITGGGDTASVIVEAGMTDDFDFVSTGGGAMLDFLTEGTLPGIDAILLKGKV